LSYFSFFHHRWTDFRDHNEFRQNLYVGIVLNSVDLSTWAKTRTNAMIFPTYQHDDHDVVLSRLEAPARSIQGAARLRHDRGNIVMHWFGPISPFGCQMAQKHLRRRRWWQWDVDGPHNDRKGGQQSLTTWEIRKASTGRTPMAIFGSGGTKGEGWNNNQLIEQHRRRRSRWWRLMGEDNGRQASERRPALPAPTE
jgi:hypothetical protein